MSTIASSWIEFRKLKLTSTWKNNLKNNINRHFCQEIHNIRQFHNFIKWISNQEVQINPKQEKLNLLRIPYLAW